MSLILGVDEAGRGPLAGPVSVGVVAFEEGFDVLAAFPGLNDSKKLSEKKREEIFGMLEERVAAGDALFVVRLSSAASIDQNGIVPSIRTALDAGVRELLPNPVKGKVFLDGALRAPSDYHQETIIGGDSLVHAIMLASVAAKVVRDRFIVREIATRFPAYGFEQHKGYGTKAHYAAITEHGLCDEHRRSFLKSFLLNQ
jgi:ribonuclease HII